MRPAAASLLSLARLRRQAGRLLSTAVDRWCRLRLDRRRGAAAGAGSAGGELTVASFFARRNGVAYGADLQIAALRGFGLAARRVDASAGVRNPLRRAAPAAPAAVAIAHADGRMVGLIYNYLGRAVASAYRVGYCAWELATPPADWASFDRILHEVWVPSEFSAAALRTICGAPVHVVPHVVLPQAGGGAAMRSRLQLAPDQFVVLTLADLRSSLARKNPFAAIAAFKAAFDSVPEARLVLKVNGTGHDAAAWQRLQEAIRGCRVTLVEASLSAADQWALFDACDVLVSLHRAEGFGLPMAEAMALGKPVVATAWSGNLDFMDAASAALVGYRLRDVDDPQGVYRSGQWADPDVEQAAVALRRLFDDAAHRRSIGLAAAQRFAPARQLRAFRHALSPEFLARTRRLEPAELETVA